CISIALLHCLRALRQLSLEEFGLAQDGYTGQSLPTDHAFGRHAVQLRRNRRCALLRGGQCPRQRSKQVCFALLLLADFQSIEIVTHSLLLSQPALAAAIKLG